MGFFGAFPRIRIVGSSEKKDSTNKSSNTMTPPSLLEFRNDFLLEAKDINMIPALDLNVLPVAKGGPNNQLIGLVWILEFCRQHNLKILDPVMMPRKFSVHV